MKTKKISVSILGGSGYAGGELLRILLYHSNVVVKQVTSRQYAGFPVSLAHPNLRKVTGLSFTSPEKLENSDLLFVALPNGESMKIMQELSKKAKKIIDLGADFRLRNQKTFEAWYKLPHQAPELLKKFVYGIAEIHRNEIKKADFIAGAGCEATVSILSLFPLIKHRLIEKKIIIDAKMSSSQSGMKPTLSSHHPERAGAVRSYMPTGHRHSAEIIQELSRGGFLPEVAISATAIDMVRGLLITAHTIPRDGITEKDVWRAYRETYQDEPFIRIIKESRGTYRYPEPKILQGANFCDIGFELDEKTNRLVIIGAIDNLVKGTAGQAVQAMNIMHEFPEILGLEFPGLHPI